MEKNNTTTLDIRQTYHEIATGKRPFLTFTNGEDTVGRLWIKNGVFGFEGNCDASADILFQTVVTNLNDILRMSLEYQLSKHKWRSCTQQQT